MFKTILNRKNHFRDKMVSYPELERLNPEWPTPRVAKFYRKFLKKQEPRPLSFFAKKSKSLMPLSFLGPCFLKKTSNN